MCTNKQKKQELFKLIGASNHTISSREENDFYATDPAAAVLLMKAVKLNRHIWEPACGQGHLARVFEKAGYVVRSADLVYRSFGETELVDFLAYYGPAFNGDIVTNPPFCWHSSLSKKQSKS